jgi:hypothetical protein
MNYELAKQLKDAGFLANRNFVHKSEILPDPYLSELIRECGKKFHMLVRWGDDSYKAHERYDFDMEQFMGEQGSGKTPEEAVAKLWLSLNKKE